MASPGGGSSRFDGGGVTCLNSKRPRILIVDDEELVLDALKRQLRSRFDVTTATGGKEAIRLVMSQGPYAVVVSDLRCPKWMA